MINVVIPMAGLGSRFSEAGFLKPKPFIDVLDSPMIEKVIQNLNIVNAKYFLIAQSEHLLREKQIVDKIKEKYNLSTKYYIINVYNPITFGEFYQEGIDDRPASKGKMFEYWQNRQKGDKSFCDTMKRTYGIERCFTNKYLYHN